MKQLILLTATVIITAFTNYGHASLNSSFTKKYFVEKVFICVSTTVKVYHSAQDCKGLGACTHTIKKVTLSEAKNEYGRRTCKVCY